MHLLQMVQSRALLAGPSGSCILALRREATKMDDHHLHTTSDQRTSKPLSTALTATRHWPAAAIQDRPPHYYASQNSCNVKMISQSTNSQNHSQNNQQEQEQRQQSSLLASIQRKLFALLYIYAILIVSLYLTYAAYYFLQQHQSQRLALTSSKTKQAQSTAQELKAGDLMSGQAGEPLEESKLEAKLHLLERYMELIAIDLQETKDKLREREKCDCSMSCHFNGTRYEDRSSWQNQCDICTCQMGKISCQPRKCPQIKCDDVQVTLPGQCCPTCMRQCKYNGALLRHGEKFNPNSKSSPTAEARKVCQCLDGRIKCEQATQQQRMLHPNRSIKTSTTTTTSSNGLVNQTTTTTTATATTKQQATRIK